MTLNLELPPYKKCFHPSWIEVDLTQLSKNISVIKKFTHPAKYCLVIKANAYGHGLYPVAKTAELSGADYLAVAHLQEGAYLREKGIKIPILVLGAIHEDQILDLINYDLEFTISSHFKADLVLATCKKHNKKCKVHLEVDTGMQRTGVRATTALTLYKQLIDSPLLDVVGIYSHFATAGPFANTQMEIFSNLTDRLTTLYGKPFIRHIANSDGVAAFPLSHLDMVRPAFLSLGYKNTPHPKELAEVAPCFSLKSRVSYFKVVAEGSGISYEHTHITKKQTRIVTVPIGFGDGYRRGLSNIGSVLIRGKRMPIVGTVCMDQFMVDAGDNEVFVGDEVVLIGKQSDQEISLSEIATLCKTTGYEILCQFNDRIPRIYLT